MNIDQIITLGLLLACGVSFRDAHRAASISSPIGWRSDDDWSATFRVTL